MSEGEESKNGPVVENLFTLNIQMVLGPPWGKVFVLNKFVTLKFMKLVTDFVKTVLGS